MLSGNTSSSCPGRIAEDRRYPAYADHGQGRAKVEEARESYLVALEKAVANEDVAELRDVISSLLRDRPAILSGTAPRVRSISLEAARRALDLALPPVR